MIYDKSVIHQTNNIDSTMFCIETWEKPQSNLKWFRHKAHLASARIPPKYS